MATANGAFHFIAPIKRTNQNTEHIAATNEPLTRNEVGNKTDNFFHKIRLIEAFKI